MFIHAMALFLLHNLFWRYMFSITYMIHARFDRAAVDSVASFSMFLITGIASVGRQVNLTCTEKYAQQYSFRQFLIIFTFLRFKY